MADKKEQTLTLPTLKEPEHIPSAPAGQLHVDLYLQGKAVPLWERGGKHAFAVAKGKTFASEKAFDELFKAY